MGRRERRRIRGRQDGKEGREKDEGEGKEGREKDKGKGSANEFTNRAYLMIYWGIFN